MENNKMEHESILKLIITMSLPPIISMMIQSLYNIVDSIFVARIGNDALVAVSLAFPLQNIVLAISVGFGVALSTCIAISLGNGNKHKVDEYVTHGIVLTFIHSLIFVVAAIFLVKPFLNMFTNNPYIIELSFKYSFTVMIFSFGLLYGLIVEKTYQAFGNMVIPMVIQILGCIVNIVLDPIFIFGKLGVPAMGVLGAAIATVIGQLVSFVTYMFILKRNQYDLKIELANFKFDKEIVKKLYSIALPSSVVMALPSFLVSILNSILFSISEVSVAFLGVYFKLQTFIYMPSAGLVQGMRPIIGYNYGAKNKERLIKTIRVSLLIVFMIMLAGTMLSLTIPDKIISLFNTDEELLKTGAIALRIISMGFVFSSAAVVISGVFEGIGEGYSSLLVSVVRQFIIIVPLSFILSKFFGEYGVWISFPISEILAMIFLLVYVKVRGIKI